MLEFCIAFSMHIGVGDGLNEIHPCVRYEQDSWTVGAFLNSESNLSAYVSYTWQSGQWFTEAGIVSGYSLLPLAPMLRVGYELSDHVALFVAPAVVDTTVGIVFGVEFTL